MNSVLLTIVILLALLIALLAIPLSLSFSITRHQQLQGYARFHWLFGLVRFQTQFPDETKHVRYQKRKPTAKHKASKKKNNARSVIALFKQSAFRRHMMKFLKTIVRATHAQNLYLKLRIGLGDPADTGMLWAVMGPLSGMMKNLKGTTIEIEPEFIDAVMEVESHGNFRFIPLQFIAVVIVFILSPVTIRAWRSTRQVKP